MRLYRNNIYALIVGIVVGFLVDYLGFGSLTASILAGLVVGALSTRLRWGVLTGALSTVIWLLLLSAPYILGGYSLEMLVLVSSIAGFPLEVMLLLNFIILMIVSIFAVIAMHSLINLTK